MSIEAEFDLDKLFLPSWAQESPSYNKYSGHTGDDRGGRRGDDRHGPRRSGPRDFPPRGREQGGGGGGDRRPPRRDGGGGGGGGGGQRFGRGPRPGGPPREERYERREPTPLPDIIVSLMPDEKGVESIAKQIKMTGRAYPVFEIAKLILQKPERQQVKFETINKEGQVAQPLFLCMLDESLWLSEAEAVSHVLDRHFDTFYKAERTQTDPPKGVFTFVAQCGISGIVLGPPNYHDYQNKLRKLHAERFARMPFEMFKSRVKIVKDEAVVKKWVEDLSWKTEYTTLNVPEAEVKQLPSRDAIENHFRQTHLPNIVKQVDSHTLSGPASRKLGCSGLQRLVRRAWDEQQRFPLKVVTYLSQQFASRGLQFFKVNKHVTHVAVSRPHYLDIEATPVSDGIAKIVEFINSHQKCTRRDLIEGIAPNPAAAKPAEGAAKPAEPAAPTTEQTAIIADLHWLVHQGHVIEFANGALETAKKPKPRPEPKKQVEKPAGGAAKESSTASESTATEQTPAVVAEEPAVNGAAEPANATPDFSEAEIADLQESAENLAESEQAAEKPAAS